MARFNSRTREGATLGGGDYGIEYRGFNSRTREGATCGLPVTVVAILVSIHAPVRVRLVYMPMKEPLASFNSRTREGATLLLFYTLFYTTFQFTHP